jgi:NAD(P)-dependent dehydrogenase (short-subunit alcohol dehydrogenase family)
MSASDSNAAEPLPRGLVRLADLAGQVAVVTGGARGLGYAVAETLADCGTSVALADLLPTVEDSAVRLAETSSAHTLGVPVDVTDPDGVAALIDQVTATLGPPTILVNAAGIGPHRAALDTTHDQWQQVLDVNLTGTFLACQAFARHCVRTGSGGRIVNIASMSAQIVNVPQAQSAYNVSKAGVEALTRSLAVEWLPLGIRVNAVSPGYVLTDMTRTVVETRPDLADVWLQRTPAGHLGDPSDIGPLVAYLASDASRFLVGQSVIIDGGYTIV